MRKANFYSVAVFFLSSIALFSSCKGNWYYCAVSGFGEAPVRNTYYIIPIDSNLIDNLEYREYATILRTRLDEKGYIQTSPRDAALCIRFGYYMKDKQYAGTDTWSGGGSFTSGTITSKTNANARGSATTVANNNRLTTNAKVNGSSSTSVGYNQYTSTTNYSTSEAIYQHDIGCFIEAFDAKNMSPIWQVEVRDQLKSNLHNSFRKVMPWMIAAAQKYFGRSGEEQVVITEKEGKTIGLVWPY